MEVDILNDILSRTISNLFMNKNKHMSYLSEDDGDVQEIFHQDIPNLNKLNNQKSNLNSLNLNNNNVNINEQPKINLIKKIINNNKNTIQKNLKQNNQNYQNQEITSPKIWCSTVGKKKYEESLNLLQINEKMIASKALINEMSLEKLTNEKAKVKQELKKYDEDFFHIFKSKPTKENKEIMKPLYYYYQKLKIAISKKTEESTNPTETLIKNDKNNNHHGNQSNNPPILTINDSILTNVVLYTNNNLITNNVLSTNPLEINRPSKYSQIINNNAYHNSMNNPGNNKINNNNYYAFHRKSNSGGGHLSNNTQGIIEEINLNKNPQKRSLSKEEINVLEQEYFNIKKEQNNLTQILRNYQNEFQKTNNRKVKWNKDIKPVEKEYNKYKANKERIKQIKELFGYIENNNNK